MGFTRAELDSYRDATVPDLIGPRCRLLFVGINPGLWTAAAGAHFARPGNRFYPALRRAGIVDMMRTGNAVRRLWQDYISSNLHVMIRIKLALDGPATDGALVSRSLLTFGKQGRP